METITTHHTPFGDPLSAASRSTHSAADASAASSPKRKRASRKGQPKRFACTYEGCDRSYSRAEHLARHQLNHSPKQVYHCEVEGCNHTFVRPDLFARHKSRHEEPQNAGANSENPSGPIESKTTATFQQPTRSHAASYGSTTNVTEPVLKKPKLSYSEPTLPTPAPAATPVWTQMHQAQNLPTPSFVQTQPSPENRQLPPLSSLSSYNSPWLGQASVGAFNEELNVDQNNDNFATWLFDSPGSHNSGFDFNNMPFLDFGMDYSMNDMWGLEDGGMQGLLGSRTYSSNSVTSEPRHLEVEEDPHIHISENRRGPASRATLLVLMADFKSRRSVLLDLLSTFMTKKRPRTDRTTQPDSILFDAGSGQWPNMSASVLESCIATFWRDVASQMPIVGEHPRRAIQKICGS